MSQHTVAARDGTGGSIAMPVWTYSPEDARRDAELLVSSQIVGFDRWSRDIVPPSVFRSNRHGASSVSGTTATTTTGTGSIESSSMDANPDDAGLASRVGAHMRLLRAIDFSIAALEAEAAGYHRAAALRHEATKSTSSAHSPAGVSLSPPLHSNKMRSNKRNCDLAVFAALLPYDQSLLSSASSPLSDKDSALKQLKRDIERDSLVVNSSPLSGAQVGLEGIVRLLADTMDAFVRESNLAPLTPSHYEGLSVQALRIAARTNSGGSAFQALQEAINPETVLVVPNSKRASPLSIKVMLGNNLCREREEDGAVNHHGSDEWGLVCRVQCSTVFDLSDISGAAETERFTMEGTYHAILFLKLHLASQYSPQEKVLSDGTPFTKLKEYIHFSKV